MLNKCQNEYILFEYILKASVESVKKDIDSVTEWFKEWLMKLYFSKFKVKNFGNKNLRSENWQSDH